MLVRDVVAQFLAWCARRHAADTVAFYRGRLRLFLEKYSDREFGSLGPLELDEHLALAGAGRSHSTRRHNAVAFEQLQAFAVENRLLEQPIVARLEKPPIGLRYQLPTAEQTQALLAVASPEFVLIYEALRQSGARPGELCRAQISDLDAARRTIVLKEHKTAKKTGQPRRILIGAKLAKLLAAAIGDRTGGPIFRTKQRKPWTPGNLTRTYARLRKRAGLPPELVLYLTRHEFGTRVVRQKGIAVAAKLLGHKSIKTTQRYEHLEEDELRAAQDE